MQYKLQVRNFIFVVLSLALLVGLASSAAAETLDTEGRWYQQQVTVTPQVHARILDQLSYDRFRQFRREI